MVSTNSSVWRLLLSLNQTSEEELACLLRAGDSEEGTAEGKGTIGGKGTTEGKESACLQLPSVRTITNAFYSGSRAPWTSSTRSLSL